MDDLISRQAAIETVKKHYRGIDNDLLEVIAYEMEELPPAQLAQDLPNGCTDTISRAAALSALNGLTKIFLNNLPPTIDRADAVDAIKELPPAQPGWIPWDSGRFPEESGTYTVTAYDGDKRRVTYAKYQKRLKRWELTGARAYWRVLAWQPQLQPWEGGQDEQNRTDKGRSLCCR